MAHTHDARTAVATNTVEVERRSRPMRLLFSTNSMANSAPATGASNAAVTPAKGGQQTLRQEVVGHTGVVCASRTAYAAFLLRQQIKICCFAVGIVGQNMLLCCQDSNAENTARGHDISQQSRLWAVVSSDENGSRLGLPAAHVCGKDSRWCRCTCNGMDKECEASAAATVQAGGCSVMDSGSTLGQVQQFVLDAGHIVAGHIQPTNTAALHPSMHCYTCTTVGLNL